MMFYDDIIPYIEYLPERLHELVEIQVLDGVINLEFQALMQELKRVIDNKSITHADIDGVSRWERMLGVTSPLNSSLTARKDALKAKLMTKPPINLTVLKGIVEAYMGVEVNISVQDFTVSITYRGESRVSDLTPLYATAYETIPANLLINIAYAYVTWGEVSTMTWGEASARTWDELRKGT